MKNFAFALTLTLSLATASIARAESMPTAAPEEAASPLSKIENANISCKDSNALYAIDTHGKRVWQGDPGMDEGLELKVTQFKTLKCPGCYDIEAKLEFLGETQELKLVLRGAAGSFTKSDLSVEAKQENGKMEEMLKLPCELITK